MNSKFSLVKYRFDDRLVKLVDKTDHKVLGKWAYDCALRVLRYFEKEKPRDKRPGLALKALKDWIQTGEFSMKVIRKASLDAHAAAREVNEDNPARSAARSAGQAVATAHVYNHSIGAAIYALQCIHRRTNGDETAVNKERDWQYKHLLELKQKG